MKRIIALLLLSFISLLGDQEIDRLRNQLHNADAPERVYIWGEMADYYWGRDPLKADSCFRQAIAEARQLDSQTVLGDITFKYGRYLYYKSKLDTAAVYLSESLRIRKAVSDSVGIGKCLSHLGLIDWLSNDISGAFTLLEEALEIQRATGEKEEQGKILTNIGNIHRQQGDYKEALNCFIEALGIYREIDYTEGIAWLNYCIGMLYKNLHEYSTALEYLEKSMYHYRILAGQSNDTGGIRICYSQIGEVNLLAGNLDTALNYLMKALDLQKRSGVANAIADGMRRVAQVYYQKGQCKEALDYAKQALEISRPLTDRSGIMDILFVLGRVYGCLDEPDSALQTFQGGLTEARKRGDKPGEARILKSIAHTYKLIGQPDSAYRYLELYTDVNESVINDQISNRITSLQVQYKLKEQEQENQRLQQDIRIQKLEADRQKFTRNIFILLFSVGLLILIGTIYLYWNKARDHRKITKARDDLRREIEERKLIEKEREKLIQEQKEALEKINTLSGLIPICSHCHKIRNDEGYYEQLEKYIMDHSDAVFSHGICPECMEKLYPDFTKKDKKK